MIIGKISMCLWKSGRPHGFRMINQLSLIVYGICSVYNHILEIRPHKTTVIEIVQYENHWSRSCCSKIQDMSSVMGSKHMNSGGKLCSKIREREIIVVSLLRLIPAIATQCQPGPLKLRMNELRGLSRAFGDHLKCADRK